MDVSIEGAALETDVAPPLGAAVVRIGERPARVSRHFAGGIAVIFDGEAGGERPDEVEKLGLVARLSGPDRPPSRLGVACPERSAIF